MRRFHFYTVLIFAWGWAISPRLYYSFGKVNINAGVLINGGFKKGEKATCGFTAGIGFDV